MKTKTVSIRLNMEEYSLLNNNSNNLNISNSEYIRLLLKNIMPNDKNHNPEIVSILSRLYIKLTELGIDHEEISQEVNALCQTLSS